MKKSINIYVVLVLIAFTNCSRKVSMVEKNHWGIGLTDSIIKNSPTGTFTVGALTSTDFTMNKFIQDSCKHNAIRTTSAYCLDSPCNTATCMICGKQWKTY